MPSAPRESRSLLGAPPRGWALAGWALLPLRAFLGATFAFAGFQKLANPRFFSASSPTSIQSQMLAAARVSPVRGLLVHLLGAAHTLGLVIAFGEVAIGLATLVGLWTRAAALFGALLSATLFLTVSFHAAPYYTGADIVFLFAWLPLVVAGGGSRLSADGAIARRAARRAGAPSPDLVVLPFAQVQQLCGHYRKGSCGARGGRPCEAAPCPVLRGERAPLLARGARDEIDRRTLVLGATSAAALGASTLAAGGVVAYVGDLIAHAGPSSTTPPLNSGTTTTTAPGSTKGPGTLLGPAKDVPVGSAASFTVPTNGDPGIVVQPLPGQFVAYDAVCPHAGCTVGYAASAHLLACPCHGSTFNVETGAVTGGPAPHGLTKLVITESSDGNLYLA